MNNKFLLALLCASALTACGQEAGQGTSSPTSAAAEVASAEPAPVIETESDRLNAWFEEKWEEELDFSPILRTFLGGSKDYDKIDDFSEAAADAKLAWQAGAVAEMKEAFDYAQLDAEAKVSYDVYAYQYAMAKAADQFRRRQYVFHQMNGPHSFLPNFLINFHRVESVDDMEAYIARISGVARAVDQSLARAKLHAEEGVHAPAFAYNGVAKQSRALITGAPFEGEGDAPLWTDVNSKIDALIEREKLDEVGAEDLRARARTALLDDFKPAFEAVVAFAEEDIANSPEVATGVISLPDGEAFYKERLAASTTTDMTPDEVHALGRAEVERIRGEMEAIKAQVGFEGSLQDFFNFVRDDDQFYYANTDEGREAYLQLARDHLASIDSQLPEFFGLLPKAGLVVKRVEAFRERDGGAQHYFPGTPDGSRPGIYYNHLSDMAAMPIPQLEVIAYHEGNPGHHMQISIAQEVEGIPTFRSQANFTVYTEGWALYSELLAKEMGAYKDPYSDFGRLTTEIWRAIRLVLDTGLHAKGWSEDQAVAYFKQNSPAAEGQIISEVRRYIVMPGQATSYKIGMIKIIELRKMAEAELGEQFDIRDFHDIVLSGGALPLAVLELRVNQWIESVKAG